LKREAIIGVKKKPLDSRQTMLEICERSWMIRMRVIRWEMMVSEATRSRQIAKMSANSWPWG
jgi:hypothetical protein